MHLDVDVAVVGAGPAGLLLAGDLARAGVSSVLLERRAERSGLTRAFAVHIRTLEELDARGVADQLVATGKPIPELEFFGGASLDMSRLPTRFPYLLITPQYETERVLEERAGQLGADIRYGAEVVALHQRADGVKLTISDADDRTRIIRAGYVVGTDGIHSTVREALGMPFPGGSVVQSVMLAEVQLTEPPPDTVAANTTGEAFALIVPFGDGWYRVIAWHRHHQPPEDAPVKLAEVRDATCAALGTDYGMHDARWMSRFHSDERQVPRYRDRRVLLAGDAAHVHSPAGGQGMNTGLQDAANLGWKLAATVQGWAPDRLLDTYHAERYPVGRQVLRTSGIMLRLGLTGPPALGAARRLLAATATRIPVVADLMVSLISGLSIAYPAPRGAHPLTGQRAEDLPLADGRRLYQALNSGHFLLTDGPSAVVTTAASGYQGRVDTAVLAHPSGAAVLFRPDAYVAWAAGPAPHGQRTPQIRAALASWCGNPRPALPIEPVAWP